jgi:hypothetical protein
MKCCWYKGMHCFMNNVTSDYLGYLFKDIFSMHNELYIRLNAIYLSSTVYKILFQLLTVFKSAFIILLKCNLSFMYLIN